MGDNYKKLSIGYCNNPRSYGSYDKQSAFTLQRSVQSISFPRTQRFSSTLVKENTINPSGSTLNSSITLNESSLKSIGESILLSKKGQNYKGASIGFGNRVNLSKIDNTPGPANYLLPSTLSKKSVSFGSKLNNNHNSFITPEPGHYNISNEDNRKILISFTDRHGFYYEDNIKQTSNLGPGQYSCKNNFNERYKKIGIGYGNKSFFQISRLLK